MLALGAPALDRLLDAPATVFFPDEMDWRDWGMMRQHAVAAFAEADMPGLLRAMKKRKWNDAAVACSGAGLVSDVRVVASLVRAAADREPLVRREAVRCLAAQRHEAATDAVVRALRDRSSDVRLTAIEALGQIGDPRTIEALEEIAAADASKYKHVAKAVSEAIVLIRKPR